MAQYPSLGLRPPRCTFGKLALQQIRSSRSLWIGRLLHPSSPIITTPR